MDFEKLKGVVKGMLWGLVILSLLALCHGCGSTGVAVVERVRTDTLYKSRIVRDSVYVSDSTSVLSKGDTVFRDRWSTRHVYHYDIDTVVSVMRDSVPYPVEVERRVEVTPPWAWWSLAAACVSAAAVAMMLRIRLR